jgi:3'-phosphoadenosine 5'-phosphosulfate sulfotransferase (PAPS reductase)/FAD synthetase
VILPPPVVLAYGIGVDSTALLIEKHARGEAPDLCLSADTGVEKPATYAYLDLIRPWMRDRGIPFELVSYTPKRFKHWPPYYGILEMCLTNATLPSKSLGGSSCSLKYKKAPQDAYLARWKPARRLGPRSAGRTPDRLRCRPTRHQTREPRALNR